MGAPLPVLERGSRASRPRSLRGRRLFLQLRRSRRRAWSGPVRVQFLSVSDSEEMSGFAFAVPRRLGTAVERNRLRRRLRAVVADAATSLPAGAYLIGVEKGACELPFQELRTRVIEATQKASGEPV